MKAILTVLGLLICNLTIGQTFSFNRSYLSEDTYCIKLKPRTSSLEINDELERFDEKRIDSLSGKQVFRIISVGVPGEIKSIVIRRFERTDSTCMLTVKVVKNAKKNDITVHTKTFEKLLWDKFNQLADTTFWNQPERAPTVKPVHDGEVLIYEFNNLGKYHRVIRGSRTEDTEVVKTKYYLNYLLNYFFDVKCKK